LKNLFLYIYIYIFFLYFLFFYYYYYYFFLIIKDDILDLIEVVSSIYSFCNDLNDSFIRYKNHAKYLKELALQLDSIYKLSENKKLLSEKGEGLLRKKKKKKKRIKIRG